MAGLTISAAAIAFAVGALRTKGSAPQPGASIKPQSSSPCAPVTEETRFADTALGQWLAALLTETGAPGGYSLSRDSLAEEHFAYTLDVPEYRGRFEMNVFAEEPDPENVDLSFLPVIARSDEYTLRGAHTGEEGFQQFIVVGGGVWVSVHVIPAPERIDASLMTAWLDRWASSAQASQAPVCNR